MYQTFPTRGFSRGLNLRDQPDSISPEEAMDLLNVTFSERGAVESRYGYSKLTSSTLTNQPDSIFPFYTSAGDKRLIVGNGNRVDAINSFPGASATNSSALTNTASPHFFARFGGPTREAVYIANGADRLKRYVAGSGFTEPAGLSGIAPKFLAVQSPDNRLVGACFVGTTGVSNPSTVRFSDAGDPETFGADNYVQLDPGDGEAITGMVAWGGSIYVFKPSTFYIFYGNSTSSTGTPVFNFRRVSTGVGLAASKALVAGRDGVYFLDRTGVYRTTGQEPQFLSGLIDPFFLRNAGIYYKSGVMTPDQIALSAMTVHQERVYLSVPTGSSTFNDRMLVFDPRYDWWSLWDIPASALCSFRPTDVAELVFAYSSSALGKHVGRHARHNAADDASTVHGAGSAITSRWRSGWQDFGNPNVKTLRETRIWGKGTCGVALSKDLLDVSSATSVTFNATAAQIAPKLVRQARRGTVFSIEFTGSSAVTQWSIHRLDHHVRDQRVPSVPRSEVA